MAQLWYFFRTQPLTCGFASLNRYLSIQPPQEPVSVLRHTLLHFAPPVTTSRHRAMWPILSNFLMPAYSLSIHSWQSLSISIIQ